MDKTLIYEVRANGSNPFKRAMNISTSKLLSNLKNGVYNGRDKVVIVYSAKNVEVVNFLSNCRYISSFEIVGKKAITIFLNYNDQALPAITELTFVSKPERSIKFKKTKRDNQKNPLSSSFFRAQFSQQKYGELAFIIR
jgi:ribosomal protein S8